MKTLIFSVGFLCVALIVIPNTNSAGFNNQTQASTCYLSTPSVISPFSELDYPIIFQLESPHHWVNGCEYWVTMTIVYLFDDDDNYLGYTTSNPSVNWNCGPPTLMNARELSFTSQTNEQFETVSIEFGLTGERDIDLLLSDSHFKNEIKSLINDNIPTP